MRRDACLTPVSPSALTARMSRLGCYARQLTRLQLPWNQEEADIIMRYKMFIEALVS